MYSTCSQGSGISRSGSPALEISPPGHSVKSTEPATQCSTSTSPTSPSSRTSPNSHQRTLGFAQTLSAEGSPAKTSALPVLGRESAEVALASGLSTSGSSSCSHRRGSSSKTSRPFALADWKKSSGASLRSGMLLDGTVFPQAPLVPAIKGTGSGSLPTVRASEYKGCGPKGSKSHSHWLHHFYLSAIVTDSGKLNPMFAERLMGMPLGWTDV